MDKSLYSRIHLLLSKFRGMKPFNEVHDGFSNPGGSCAWEMSIYHINTLTSTLLSKRMTRQTLHSNLQFSLTTESFLHSQFCVGFHQANRQHRNTENGYNHLGMLTENNKRDKVLPLTSLCSLCFHQSYIVQTRKARRKSVSLGEDIFDRAKNGERAKID